MTEVSLAWPPLHRPVLCSAALRSEQLGENNALELQTIPEMLSHVSGPPSTPTEQQLLSSMRFQRSWLVIF